MSTQALLQSLKESILSQASVKAIYGEPIAAHGKTVIPVARIMYGYGAGAGTGGVGDTRARGEGGGGGGGVRAIPVGVIEVSDQQTRFVPITDRKKLTGAVLAGIGLGMFLGWRRRRWLKTGLPGAFVSGGCVPIVHSAPSMSESFQHWDDSSKGWLKSGYPRQVFEASEVGPEFTPELRDQQQSLLQAKRGKK
jgi:uncharacterized spore protein YtfJ